MCYQYLCWHWISPLSGILAQSFVFKKFTQLYILKIIYFRKQFQMKITMVYALPLKPIKIFYQVNEVAQQFGIYLYITIEDYSSISSSASWNRCGKHTTDLHMLCEGALLQKKLKAQHQAKLPKWARIVDRQIMGFMVGLSCCGLALHHCLSSRLLSSCTA